MYIHESLAEYIQCGNTSFPVTGAYHKICELGKCNDDDKTGFESQYEVSCTILLMYSISH